MGQIVYLSLGSNLGERKTQLQEALSKIEETSGKILNVSSFYETPPWGFESKNNFLNICAELETEVPVERLLLNFQKIEEELGRIAENTAGYSSRTIDIDILTYGDLQLKRESLHIPHPRMEMRNFVLLPLQEIAPNFVHPKTTKTIQQIIDACTDETSVKLYESK